MEPSCDYPACIGGECQWECERFDLWKKDQDDGQPDEAHEWRDFDPDC